MHSLIEAQGRLIESHSSSKIKKYIGPETPRTEDEDLDPEENTIVLNMQKEYEKHLEILRSMVEMRESYFEYDVTFKRLFGFEPDENYLNRDMDSL